MIRDDASVRPDQLTRTAISPRTHRLKATVGGTTAAFDIGPAIESEDIALKRSEAEE